MCGLNELVINAGRMMGMIKRVWVIAADRKWCYVIFRPAVSPSPPDASSPSPWAACRDDRWPPWASRTPTDYPRPEVGTHRVTWLIRPNLAWILESEGETGANKQIRESHRENIYLKGNKLRDALHPSNITALVENGVMLQEWPGCAGQCMRNTISACCIKHSVTDPSCRLYVSPASDSRCLCCRTWLFFFFFPLPRPSWMLHSAFK